MAPSSKTGRHFNARDGAKDQIDCGTGNDHVTVDAIDVVASNCEHVALPGRARD